ncbi:hypothetical protein [Noviherbaspirillum saxi]|uniref:DUF2188 domain-containing protein n=1 Tax=Noviherbaspirillum saxi TaxID=2320863 RepID=A0A3A3FS66_9BURK|nr:hypothetical protein [Noviherbaspirillum saxi]RJF99057.1 hypothetical protein D3871_11435 [Noviherbaspirillum saxi]
MEALFKKVAQHGRMYTFERSKDGKAIDLVRGFGATEAAALEYAKADFYDNHGQPLYRIPTAALSPVQSAA